MIFYTKVDRFKNHLYVKGYKDGKSFKEKIIYSPYLFVEVDSESQYKTIDGKNVGRIDFPTMWDASEFCKNHESQNIYGLKNYEYLYIYDNYPENFKYDYSHVNVVYFDIETDSSGSFPNIDIADKEITAITLGKKGTTITLGYGDYYDVSDKKYYIKCENEKELLTKFIKIWKSAFWLPDVISGWNSQLFDIPYIINRIKRILGEEYANKLSPFGIIRGKSVKGRNGKEFKSYDIVGISSIDYLMAYRKFKPAQVESFKLDHIAEITIGEKKLDYSEYESLDELYRKDFVKFINYNIHDTLLVERMEGRLHFIEQMVSTAYVQRVNYEDTLGTVRPWDIIIHNDLMDNGIVIPSKIKVPEFQNLESIGDEEGAVGGYVKEPVPGRYEWIASLDFRSLYPSIAMQYNISTDSFVRKLDPPPNIDSLINGNISSKFTNKLIEQNICMTANGCFFKKDERGFFPRLLKKFFDGRIVYKKKMLELEKELEKDPDNNELKNEHSRYDNLQNSYKLIGNSGFGAYLNKYFRWFDNDLGEAITLSGQMTTQYIAIKINEYLGNKFGIKKDFVIYQDTDSAYIDLIDFVNEYPKIATKDQIIKVIIDFMEKDLAPFVNKVCKELAEKLNVYEVKTEVKLEKICDASIFVAKKRYILQPLYSEGVFIEKVKAKVTGLETVRSSVPIYTRKALEKCYDIVLNKSKEDLYKFVKDFKEEFFTQPIDMIAAPTSVNGIVKYNGAPKGTPVHVKASLIYNKFLEDNNLTNKYERIEDHDKMKWVYLKMPNQWGSETIGFKGNVPKELDIYSFVDYHSQYEKVFLTPLKTVLNAVKWDAEKKDTLEDMFG